MIIYNIMIQNIILIFLLVLAFFLKENIIEGFNSSLTKVVEIDCGNNSTGNRVCYPAKAGQNWEGSPGPASCLSDNKDECETYHLSNLVYYPRYRPWFRHIKDLKTRPEYERTFTPYWNTHYNPNITSDIYYEKVAADHIMPLSYKTPYIKKEHDDNFYLRQDII